MTIPESSTGHCLCGAVRFAFDGAPAWTGHCHCDSCRRNCSAPFTTFFGIARDRLRWTGAAPQVHESSPGVRRLFCRTCGTPMAYDADWDKRNIHLYAASLEDHSRIAPSFHVHHAEAVPWVTLGDDLVRHPQGAS